MTTAGTVLVAGSANLDFVVRAAHVPAPGETVLGREFATFPGGKGANQAVASARAGGAYTRMLLALGDDPYATVLDRALAEAGVERHVIRAPDVASGTAFICLSDDAENAITVAPGANAALRPHHLPSLQGVSHLLLQLETPLDTVASFAHVARTAGVKVMLNAAPATSLPAGLLGDVDVLVVNEGELATLAGPGTLAEQLARVQVPCVVVTLGARGCIARRGGELFLQPAFPVEAVDTTAAGDTFCGALAARLAQHASLADALRFASAASALACTRLGAQTSVPARAEVDAWLAAQANETPRRAALAAYSGFPAS
ncbi:ribokinase [Pseudoxanthomonas sp. PXM02]|uniref:ribokinase n=1 Tax=Pseudoxanthomonas sp. PXM02 TaxID=2769294 RepID=UPI0017874CCF|nr:ribokinase [Pseudoxanthomonas sp. PXM02]MBD9479234.1 ribokinase [Pseudoxanthomonas sp. PXM02]